MAWVKFTDDFYDNLKMDHVGPLGVALWAVGMGYCNRNLTDGVIHRSKALRLLDFEGLVYEGESPDATADITITALVDAGLWHADGHNCDECVQPGRGRYVVHNYLEYQPSRRDVLARREAEAARKAAARQKAAATKAASKKSAGSTASVQEVSDECPSGTPDGIREVSDDCPALPVPAPVVTTSSASADAERALIDDEFDDWWELYPLKKDKVRARKSYKTARKKTSADTIMQALQAQLPELQSRPVEKRPYATTWLNGERWDDEVLAATAATGSPAARPATQAQCDLREPHAPHRWSWGVDTCHCQGIHA
ncbi:hypothetical protein [Nocardioides ochotonae]|uniref:hypothetical protein n=1 Tax=Nocardioides ochotonae TaxID=2685869 RepID=UPI0014080867|nr:hypothetical protein [Nocardioides ochotonae]